MPSPRINGARRRLTPSRRRGCGSWCNSSPIGRPEFTSGRWSKRIRINARNVSTTLFARWRIGCGMVLAALWLTGCHTPPQPTGPVVSVPMLQAEVRQEFQNSVAAWNAGDLNGFVQIYADNATFATPDGFLSGKL